ncbi:MAG: polymer-forming cytoskeletal protein [Candidatus Aminicenantales bacterium]
MTLPDKKEPSLEHPDGVSHLSPTSLIQGEFSGREDLVIRGQVRGKIALPENDLLVDSSGRVEAEARVKNVRIRGEFVGNITASGKVIIERTGRVKGDLSASLISIEDGAQFKGAVKVMGKP